MAKNPHIKITISCQSTFDTISALREGTIDIGLVGLLSKADTAEANTITYLPLKTIEDIFVATESYLMPFLQKYKGDISSMRSSISSESSSDVFTERCLRRSALMALLHLPSG